MLPHLEFIVVFPGGRVMTSLVSPSLSSPVLFFLPFVDDFGVSEVIIVVGVHKTPAQTSRDTSAELPIPTLYEQRTYC